MLSLVHFTAVTQSERPMLHHSHQQMPLPDVVQHGALQVQAARAESQQKNSCRVSVESKVRLQVSGPTSASHSIGRARGGVSVSTRSWARYAGNDGVVAVPPRRHCLVWQVYPLLRRQVHHRACKNNNCNSQLRRRRGEPRPPCPSPVFGEA